MRSRPLQDASPLSKRIDLASLLIPSHCVTGTGRARGLSARSPLVGVTTGGDPSWLRHLTKEGTACRAPTSKEAEVIISMKTGIVRRTRLIGAKER